MNHAEDEGERSEPECDAPLDFVHKGKREPINTEEAARSVAERGRTPIRAEGGTTRGWANLSRRRAKGDWGLRARKRPMSPIP